MWEFAYEILVPQSNRGKYYRDAPQEGSPYKSGEIPYPGEVSAGIIVSQALVKDDLSCR